jgi:hypothetical protein
MLAIETPIFTGSSGVPVRLTSPATQWMSR